MNFADDPSEDFVAREGTIRHLFEMVEEQRTPIVNWKWYQQISGPGRLARLMAVGKL